MKNRILANVTSTDDFIVSDHFISLLMSQYVTLHEPVNFYTVLESACRKNETAIGYRLMDEAKSIEKNYGVVINPVKIKGLLSTKKTWSLSFSHIKYW